MLLDRPTLLRAFERLDAQLAVRGVRAELFLVGGAVMCLVHQARPATKDVDGWFTEPQDVRAAARVVAGELESRWASAGDHVSARNAFSAAFTRAGWQNMRSWLASWMQSVFTPGISASARASAAPAS